ncbi:MAG TPA: DUF790 family protein, partial [Polyangiaceae bacterium]|nr:DUF790 family protein [Polyangiaceae bacterium]
MLSFDHVRLRRKGQELVIQPLGGRLRERALELGRALGESARLLVGKTREELEDAFEAIQVAPSERRLFAGLSKLVEDECEFEMVAALEPSELRGELFSLAADRRKNGEFSRASVLSEIAQRLARSEHEVEAALFADLRSAHRLLSCHAPGPEALLQAYEHGQVQAVLLRAVKVMAEVRCRSPDAYRELFRKLKFRQLLHKIAPLADGGYRIEIDGPYSLFDSVAKYGLELALTLPALEACDDLELVAMVKPRDGGEPLLFRHRAEGSAPRAEPPPLREEVEQLLLALNAPDTGVVAR